MSTATLPATTNGHQNVPAVATQIDAATLERVVCDGDLSRLSPAQKVTWYKARCEAAGLNPRTQPFQYVSLSGKVVLYATKTATDQLIALHKITVKILGRTFDENTGIYEVHCSAAFPDGRSAEDVGALYIGAMKGEPLANAIMKAVTKSKRRTVLSACGLGMLDETEVETIPGAHHAANHPNDTGHGRTGAYAPPDVVREYQAWLADFTQAVNSKWLDHWTGPDGEVRDGAGELVSPYRLSGHLVKHFKAVGLIQAPDEPRTRQYDPLAAVAWSRDAAAVEGEAKAYCRRLWSEAKAKLTPPEPEDAPQVPPVEPEDVTQDDGDVDIPEGY